MNDPYVAEAKKRGYRSRAAFKILQLDEKYHFFKIGGRIVDLGAAPGGWTQVAVDRVHSADGRGKVIGIDLQFVEPIPGATIIQLDFMDASAPDKLKELLEGQADVVLSDMAASSTGHAQTDHLKIIDLAETALGLCLRSAGTRRHLHRQGAARRGHQRIADSAEEAFRQRATCEAGCQPQGFGRDLRGGARVPELARRNQLGAPHFFLMAEWVTWRERSQGP